MRPVLTLFENVATSDMAPPRMRTYDSRAGPFISSLRLHIFVLQISAAPSLAGGRRLLEPAATRDKYSRTERTHVTRVVSLLSRPVSIYLTSLLAESIRTFEAHSHSTCALSHEVRWSSECQGVTRIISTYSVCRDNVFS